MLLPSVTIMLQSPNNTRICQVDGLFLRPTSEKSIIHIHKEGIESKLTLFLCDKDFSYCFVSVNSEDMKDFPSRSFRFKINPDTTVWGVFDSLRQKVNEAINS